MEYPKYEALLAKARPQFNEKVFAADDTSRLDADAELRAVLTEAREQERDRIESALKSIDQQLQDRKAIHEQTVESLQQALHDERDRLETVSQPSTPADRVLEQKRQIHDLEQQLNEEHQAHWRDRETLETERRRLRRDLGELLDTDLSGLF